MEETQGEMLKRRLKEVTENMLGRMDCEAITSEHTVSNGELGEASEVIDALPK